MCAHIFYENHLIANLLILLIFSQPIGIFTLCIINDQHSLSLVDIPFSPALVTNFLLHFQVICPSFAVTMSH
jgi:hypothetical protein